MKICSVCFTTDIPGLEEDLRIFTPNQILSGLPISLGQLKAGNNSKILKKEIRQLLYHLQRSKRLIK